MSANVNSEFWKSKNVFLTGHSGFKGSWLSLWLSSMGAIVTGYSLSPNTNPNLYTVLGVEDMIEKSHFANVRDFAVLQNAMQEANPEIVIHMAAQPLVRYSYVNPVDTFATNVMGTVHVLECIRHIQSVRSTVVVTTDKCYENKEWIWGYREHEPMGGGDPYSNSKGCAELVTSAYRQSFFSESGTASQQNLVASARAGNVIGGGDWAEDRLIADAFKAFASNRPLKIRNPFAVRPWQHVLEPLSGYLILAQLLYENGRKFASAWNFGPQDNDARSVQDVINLLINEWGYPAAWEKDGSEQPHEAHLLKLDISKAKYHLNWNPRWNLEMAVEKIVEWQRAFQCGFDMKEFSLNQIHQYTNTL